MLWCFRFHLLHGALAVPALFPKCRSDYDPSFLKSYPWLPTASSRKVEILHYATSGPPCFLPTCFPGLFSPRSSPATRCALGPSPFSLFCLPPFEVLLVLLPSPGLPFLSHSPLPKGYLSFKTHLKPFSLPRNSYLEWLSLSLYRVDWMYIFLPQYWEFLEVRDYVMNHCVCSRSFFPASKCMTRIRD